LRVLIRRRRECRLRDTRRLYSRLCCTDLAARQARRISRDDLTNVAVDEHLSIVRGSATLDALFREAVSAIDSCDVTTLERLVAENPALVRDRLAALGAWLGLPVRVNLENPFGSAGQSFMLRTSFTPTP